MKILQSAVGVFICLLPYIQAVPQCDPDKCTSKCCTYTKNTCSTSATSSDCYYKDASTWYCGSSTGSCPSGYTCSSTAYCKPPGAGADYSCDPEKCSSKCCKSNKYQCATSKTSTDCKYTSATEWTCFASSSCPSGYHCSSWKCKKDNAADTAAGILCCLCYCCIPVVICAVLIYFLARGNKTTVVMAPAQPMMMQGQPMMQQQGMMQQQPQMMQQQPMQQMQQQPM